MNFFFPSNRPKNNNDIPAFSRMIQSLPRDMSRKMSRDFFKKSLVVLWVTWIENVVGVGYRCHGLEKSFPFPVFWGVVVIFSSLRVSFVGNFLDLLEYGFLVAWGGMLEMQTCLFSKWFRLLIKQVWNVPVVVLLSRCICSSGGFTFKMHLFFFQHYIHFFLVNANMETDTHLFWF